MKILDKKMEVHFVQLEVTQETTARVSAAYDILFDEVMRLMRVPAKQAVTDNYTDTASFGASI